MSAPLLARLAAQAAVTAALAAGAVRLPPHVANLAIGEADIPEHVKATLHAITHHQNTETGRSYPSLERIARHRSKARRTVIEAMKLATELSLERNGLTLVREPRWHSAQRGPGERDRSSLSWILFSPALAARAGWRAEPLVQEPPALPVEEPLAPPAPPAPSEASSPAPPTPSEALPPTLPVAPEPPRPIEAPTNLDVILVRDACARHPETCEFASEAVKLIAIGRRRGKNMARILQAITDCADKSDAAEPLADRRDRLVSFLRAADERVEKPQISAAARREVDTNEARDKVARRRLDAATARAIGLLPDARTANKPDEPADDLRDRVRRQREALAAWQQENEDKPP